MPHSTAAAVEKALEEAALRTGVPRLIVSDEGTDVRGGIERYRDTHHDQTVATCDLAHKGANLLRKLLEADELWPGYAARLGTTKAKLQQTSLACFASPTLRPKARFMNLAVPLRWARWCLRALDQPWPVEPTVSERQQSVLATIDREQLEARLGWLRDYREAIERWSQWHEVIQVVIRHVRRHGIERNTVATLRGRLATVEPLAVGPGGRRGDDRLRRRPSHSAQVRRGTVDCQYGDPGIALRKLQEPGAAAVAERSDRADAGDGSHGIHLDGPRDRRGLPGHSLEGGRGLD